MKLKHREGWLSLTLQTGLASAPRRSPIGSRATDLTRKGLIGRLVKTLLQPTLGWGLRPSRVELPLIRALPPCVRLPSDPGASENEEGPSKEWKLGHPNSFPKASALGPAGNQSALGQPTPHPRLCARDQVGAGCSAQPCGAGERRRSAGGAPGDRSGSHTPPVPATPTET